MKVFQNIAVAISFLLCFILCLFLTQLYLLNTMRIFINLYHWWSVEVTYNFVPKIYQILGIWIHSSDVIVGFNYYHNVIVEINMLSIFSAVIFIGFYYLASLYIKKFQDNWKIELPTITTGIIGSLSLFLRSMGSEFNHFFVWIMIASAIVNGIMWAYLKEKARYTKYLTYISAGMVVLAFILEKTDLMTFF